MDRFFIPTTLVCYLLFRVGAQEHLSWQNGTHKQRNRAYKMEDQVVMQLTMSLRR